MKIYRNLSQVCKYLFSIGHRLQSAAIVLCVPARAAKAILANNIGGCVTAAAEQTSFGIVNALGAPVDSVYSELHLVINQSNQTRVLIRRFQRTNQLDSTGRGEKTGRFI